MAPISICPASPLSSSAASSQTEMTDDPSSSATQAPGSGAPSGPDRNDDLDPHHRPARSVLPLLLVLVLLGLVPRFRHEYSRVEARWCRPGTTTDVSAAGVKLRVVCVWTTVYSPAGRSGTLKLSVVLTVAGFPQLDRSEHVEAGLRYRIAVLVGDEDDQSARPAPRLLIFDRDLLSAALPRRRCPGCPRVDIQAAWSPLPSR